jgi:lipopolysaccharide export system protein LptC
MNTPNLDLLSPTAPKRVGHGHLYRQIVRGARYLLAVGMLSIVVVVFLWPDLRQAPVTTPDLAGVDAATNQLEHPQFDSVDAQGQPYRLQAERAVQDKTNPDRVDLIAPVGIVDLKDGKKMSLTGQSGVYAQEKKVMNLSGKVEMTEDHGMQLKTEQMTIDLQSGTVHAPGPVEAAGPMGTLKATGMVGDRTNNTLIFQGPATLTLPEENKK